MASLRFSFGTMGSGKSTLALQIHHNLTSRGLFGILCSQLDRAGGKVSSALGVSADAVQVSPGFNLYDQDGNEVNLGDFTGEQNVVLYFYPKAMTPGCTTQACGLRNNKKELAILDAVALGISPDPIGRLKKFEEKESLNFTLLSDEDHSVTETYGVWGLKKFMGREFMGVIRTTFIINRQGEVVHIMDKVKTKSHHDDVIDVLKSLD